MKTGASWGRRCWGHRLRPLIHEAVLALAFGATAEELARLPHYHPTLSEVFALAAEQLALEIGQTG